MLTTFDKAIAGAVGPLLAWGVLSLLQHLFGPVPADVAAGVQTLASLAVTGALVWLVPNRPAAPAAAAEGRSA